MREVITDNVLLSGVDFAVMQMSKDNQMLCYVSAEQNYVQPHLQQGIVGGSCHVTLGSLLFGFALGSRLCFCFSAFQERTKCFIFFFTCRTIDEDKVFVVHLLKVYHSQSL